LTVTDSTPNLTRAEDIRPRNVQEKRDFGMQGTSVLFGQILAVFGIVIAGVWGATQWTAAHLGFSYRLGAPWFDCFGVPVYHPWALFEWWYWFNAYAPHLFLKGGESRR